MEKALISLGEKDLRTLIDEDDGAELVCHFCRSKYFFTTEQLKSMLTFASTEKRRKISNEDANN